ncbi:hypothetical protein ACQCX5_07575 [Propionibacteriaceae bacterium G57]|uniref:hypothetical protein n=1 Tax=Aestuariimicrobium sp. G57 TaxID=3418485 RepID=UPI003DA742D7
MKHPSPTFRALAAPLVGTGLAMATYLVLRPYGDAGDDPGAAAAAFASPLWVTAHLFGVLAIAQFARLALRLDESLAVAGHRSPSARAARTLALVGAVLCLPYYGAETFGLHALGAAQVADPSAGMLAVVDQVRNHPAALATFGLGLVALSVAGVLVALAWSRRATVMRWAAWPLGLAMALFPAQFFVPPVGRVGYGVAFAVCAGIWLVAAQRPQDGAHVAESGPARGGEKFLSEGYGTVKA